MVSGISGVVYETCWYLRGLEQWFIDMLTQPEFCEALLDHTLQFWLDWFRLFLDEVADLVDVIMIGDDLAGQKGPLFRPAIYRQIVKPRQKQLVQYIRSRTPAKIWYHTCGACAGYIPDLLDNGIDILNPVQISAAGHGPGAVKGRFGDQVVFWGGAIDAQHVLPTATPETVRAEVRREYGKLEASRRLRLQQRAQHPGRRAAGEHRGLFRRGLRVRVAWAARSCTLVFPEKIGRPRSVAAAARLRPAFSEVPQVVRLRFGANPVRRRVGKLLAAVRHLFADGRLARVQLEQRQIPVAKLQGQSGQAGHHKPPPGCAPGILGRFVRVPTSHGQVLSWHWVSTSSFPESSDSRCPNPGRTDCGSLG